MDPGHGTVDGGHGGSGEEEDQQRLEQSGSHREYLNPDIRVLPAQPRCHSDLKKVQHHHDPGIKREDAGKQQKVLAVELRGAVQYFAECEGAKVGFHAGSLFIFQCGLRGY